MKKNITSLFLSGFLLLTLASGGYAQTALPYYTGFDNAAEKAGWTEYQLGVNDDPYHWEYGSTGAYTDPQCVTHYYPVGGSQQTDDWFVSPEFDFSNGATIDSLRYAFTGFGTPMAGDTIGIYLLTGSQDPAAATSVTMLYSFSDSTYMNDNLWRKTAVFDIPATSGPSYIAFRYTTVVNWLDIRLDNLSISAQPIGVEAHAAEGKTLRIFPNPALNTVQIEGGNGFKENKALTLKLYDTAGTLIFEITDYPGTHIDISMIVKGMYIYHITDENNRKLNSGKVLLQ